MGGKWYFTREEIEKESPSRSDGISLKKEAELRRSYCLFLKEFGTKLKVPTVTISYAMMLCHHFYMRQSHAKNDWQTVATSSMLIACKAEESPRYLNDIVFVGHEIAHKSDPVALQRIRDREVFRKQRELILVGERLVLQTIGFDFDLIRLPFDPLESGLKILNVAASFPGIDKLARCLVEEWLQTTLCLQFKPHCIAVGSVAIAAEILKVKPSRVLNGKAWWDVFEVSPKELDEVGQRMRGMLKKKADRKPALPPPPPQPNTARNKFIQSETLSTNPSGSSSQSCVSSEATVDWDSRKKQRTAL